MTITELINLLEMMANTNLSAIDEGVKIKHDSYMKGKGDAYTEVIKLLKQVQIQEDKLDQIMNILFKED